MNNPASQKTALFLQAYPRGGTAFLNLVANNVKLALAEDIGAGDLTAQLIPATKQANASIIARESAVICGQDWLNACFNLLDKNIKIDWQVAEGERVMPNQLLCKISGNARAMLSAERCALNFLQTLSATATETAQYVALLNQGLSDKKAEMPKTQILDTRKTIPGLRLAQKYAVTVGGGFNQRLALYDGILIKENHIAAAGSIAAAMQAALATDAPSIQIEVENLDELKQALNAGATSILLDNFSLDELREAVKINQHTALLEASGNVNEKTLVAIAETGVDRISIGGLTKHIRAIDLSMRIALEN